MVLKRMGFAVGKRDWFENDVEMYGTQTTLRAGAEKIRFENDVEMYGTQTMSLNGVSYVRFENDVEMYGTQTK